MNMTEGNTPPPTAFDEWYRTTGQHMEPAEKSTLRIAFWHVWQAATEAAAINRKPSQVDVLAQIRRELYTANRLKELEMRWAVRDSGKTGEAALERIDALDAAWDDKP